MTESLLSMKDAATLIGRSRQWVYEKLRDDPTFPRPVRLSPHSIAFKRSELDEWINTLPRAEPNGVDAIARRQLASVAVA